MGDFSGILNFVGDRSPMTPMVATPMDGLILANSCSNSFVAIIHTQNVRRPLSLSGVRAADPADGFTAALALVRRLRV